MLHLFDTALGQVTPIEARRPGQLSVYVCGPTVSGEPHLGHGRFTLTWDVLRRYLTWSGIEVRYVSNITDIEDKIIARAASDGTTTEQVAATYEKVWWDAMDRLGVLRPTEDPHATRYVPQMVELIEGLIRTGHAYVGGDGVYFASETVPDYGLLARQPLESLRSGARIEVTEESGKRSPVDFVLWKLAKPGEPSWLSPWGDGRPGWHTECVVMSLDLLGDGFDLHGGGNDLAFPHHENERAQAEAIGRPFARHWVHSGMVEAEGGEKMSKSLGNTLSLPELLDAHDPRVLRLQVLQSHYRSPITIGPSTLAAATNTLRGLDTFASDFAPARSAAPDPEVLALLRERMDDDLDTPGALRLLFDARDRARTATAAGSGADAARWAATVFEIAEVFGLPIGREDTAVPADIQALVDERTAARAARDFARSDALRDQLAAAGWIVEDGPSGTTLHR
ncbi:cysteine--tRNA ligase [Acidiferrimicrobium sp. IK]|uniref:cysteine--tRNA ligase n=1 Tax=Acidiferrimicrobium sp. IK TaxID=2871700 RepID=UPI0021CB40F7|nr:cysteine--tRNA ligase [Acidiferrimicrobium sp. IK]MCU4185875.1 cysteine--tRNA ligase [Acidiferrimicrobium sp. IK]